MASRERDASQPSPAPATMKRFYSSETFSDVTLRFSGLSLKAHKVVLCSHSRWFERALEGEFSDASKPVLTLHDDDPSGLEDLIRCFYDSGDRLLHAPQDDSATTFDERDALAQRLVSTAICADKYDAAPALRASLASSFDRTLTTLWKKEGHTPTLAPLIDDVYANLPPASDLRRILVQQVGDHLSTFGSDALRALLDSRPEFATDVLVWKAASGASGATTTAHKTALHWAAQVGDVEECRKLMDDRRWGVDVQDENGETPLHFAAWYGSVECVRLLLSRGADVNAVSHKFPTGSPRAWAMNRGHEDIISVLNEAGANH